MMVQPLNEDGAAHAVIYHFAETAIVFFKTLHSSVMILIQDDNRPASWCETPTHFQKFVDDPIEKLEETKRFLGVPTQSSSALISEAFLTYRNCANTQKFGIQGMSDFVWKYVPDEPDTEISERSDTESDSEGDESNSSNSSNSEGNERRQEMTFTLGKFDDEEKYFVRKGWGKRQVYKGFDPDEVTAFPVTESHYLFSCFRQLYVHADSEERPEPKLENFSYELNDLKVNSLASKDSASPSPAPAPAPARDPSRAPSPAPAPAPTTLLDGQEETKDLVARIPPLRRCQNLKVHSNPGTFPNGPQSPYWQLAWSRYQSNKQHKKIRPQNL